MGILRPFFRSFDQNAFCCRLSRAKLTSIRASSDSQFCNFENPRPWRLVRYSPSVFSSVFLRQPKKLDG